MKQEELDKYCDCCLRERNLPTVWCEEGSRKYRICDECLGLFTRSAIAAIRQFQESPEFDSKYEPGVNLVIRHIFGVAGHGIDNETHNAEVREELGIC